MLLAMTYKPLSTKPTSRGAPVNTIEEAQADPHVVQRGRVVVRWIIPRWAR